ncbi:MAG: peptidoglycan DD-metalloendopeptidase family protein [Gallionellaceae bacterium]|jgi:lipoprotein NlpD
MTSTPHTTIVHRGYWLFLHVLALSLVGCAVPQRTERAPIVEYGDISKSGSSTPRIVARAPVKKNVLNSGQVYVVQKGDTLYSIAFLNGVDYVDIAELNDIEDPSFIKIGQQLSIPASTAPKMVEKKQPFSSQPVVEAGGVKTQPKAGKVPYSDKALAQAEKVPETPKLSPAVAPVAAEVTSSKEVDDEEALEWGMPSIGKVIAEFSESANRKGVDISGKQGQAVVASATGKVVYSGSGLRGYGKLVIIKHNKTYLSAYAHNDQILVKEGQSVSKGQKIAEMGNTDAEQVKLHFEIRKFGKPVDPAQFLPLIKS